MLQLSYKEIKSILWKCRNEFVIIICDYFCYYVWSSNCYDLCSNPRISKSNLSFEGEGTNCKICRILKWHHKQEKTKSRTRIFQIFIHIRVRKLHFIFKWVNWILYYTAFSHVSCIRLWNKCIYTYLKKWNGDYFFQT